MPPVTGEIAPGLSPLDIFAAQSRALARQLEDSRKNGRRVSRLPPLAVADGLAKRPGFVPAPIEELKETTERETSDPPSASSGNKLEIEDPSFRPKSYYPRFSSMPVKEESEPLESPISRDETFVTPLEQPMGDYFERQRNRSPEYFSRPRTSVERVSQASNSRPKTSFDSLSRNVELERGGSVESTSSRRSQFSNSNSLLPPNPPYARKTPSIRSVDSDDDNPGITPSSSFSQYRKFSGSSSGFSAPQSPQSAFAPHLHHNRTPSQNSDYSLGGTRLAKPSFNFSRPRSRGMAPVDTPPEMPTPESHPRIFGEEDARSTVSREAVIPGEQEEIPDLEDSTKTAASSYIYAKYSLPRGRMVSRDSLPLDSLMPKFEWEKSSIQNSSARPPLQTVNSSRSLTVPDYGAAPRTSTESAPGGPLTSPPLSAPASPALPPASPALPRTSTESAPVVPAIPPTSPPPEIPHRHSMTSMQTGNSGSTIKAPKQPDRMPPLTGAGAGDLTAEEHLTKGIALHEQGALSESTYHLRRAARANSPTAMLLYALACRHGWGMRPHPAEGVTWLRKALDCASIEMTHGVHDDDPAAAPAAGGPDAEGRKTRKAQFALSMYELGVSHLNGWGVEQDRALALRCFEVAASWGDADAMAEAGFCYAQGVGARKDLRKAARYYRRAESKGMSMVGNSW